MYDDGRSYVKQVFCMILLIFIALLVLLYVSNLNHFVKIVLALWSGFNILFFILVSIKKI